jgi:hypothetical protein
MVSDTSTVVRSSEPLTAAVDGEIVMLSPAQGAYYGLNGVGSRIWELLARPSTVDGVCATLTAEFDVDDAACRTAVLAFLDDLRQAGLVQVGP